METPAVHAQRMGRCDTASPGAAGGRAAAALSISYLQLAASGAAAAVHLFVAQQVRAAVPQLPLPTAALAARSGHAHQVRERRGPAHRARWLYPGARSGDDAAPGMGWPFCCRPSDRCGEPRPERADHALPCVQGCQRALMLQVDAPGCRGRRQRGARGYLASCRSQGNRPRSLRQRNGRAPRDGLGEGPG